MERVLFLWSQNLQRGPTAEAIYRGRADLEVQSAGVHPGAERRVTAELLEWADVVFVFEPAHRQALYRAFPAIYPRLYIECLGIPDEYGFMDPEWLPLLREKLNPHLEPPTG